MNKILVVDDEVKICDILKRYLERNGYEVIVSNSGEDALEKVRHEKPDIVLLDIKMPGMGGIEVLKETRKINQEIMAIIYTAHGKLVSAIDAIRLNAFDYVLKTTSLEELCSTVDRCSEKLELQRKAKPYEKLLPVCCVCKKIRDDTNKETGAGKWMKMEDYLNEKAGITVTHSLCPECFKETYKKELPFPG